VNWGRGVPAGPNDIEIFGDPPADAEFEDRWRETFREGTRFLSNVLVSRLESGNVVSFARGEIRVDDRHTRLSVPISQGRPGRLAEIFGINAELLEEAFSIAGDPAPADSRVRLTAYLESSRTPAQAFAAIADAASYQRLWAGIADVADVDVADDSWRLSLVSPSNTQGLPGASLTEQITRDRDRLELAIRRVAGDRETDGAFRVEEHSGRTYLVREAVLPGTGEELLRHDGLRGRLAGTLAVDLLAWTRMIDSSRGDG